MPDSRLATGAAMGQRTGPGQIHPARRGPARLLSSVALAGIVVVLVIFAALHLLPPTDGISPVTRTISEYALTSSAWAFDLGVILLAAASAAVFAGLAMIGRTRAVSVTTALGALWVAGLLTLVGFPKHNWAVSGPSQSGQIHRMASLIAFVALPIAVLVVTRRRRGADASRPGVPEPVPARCAFWLGAASLVWFSPIAFAIVSSFATGRPWWQAIPLGLIERGMALTEVLAVAALALLVRARSAPPTNPAVNFAGPPPTA